MLYAYNLDYGDTGSTTTINGVTFTGVNIFAPGFSSPDFSITGTGGYDGTGNKDGSTTGFAPGDTLYTLEKNGAYYNLTLTLKGLTVGQTYAAQLEITEQPSDNRQQSYTDGSVTSDIVYAHAGPMFITDTFTATGATEVLQANYSGGQGAQLAGFVVESAPEPSTWAMMIGGAAALLAFACRRGIRA